MRINLKTPFAEKDAVKALGARWDAARKIWYITDVADLTPFMRWIPDLQAASEEQPLKASAVPQATQANAPSNVSSGVITKPQTGPKHCGCNILPWLDCQHTAGAAPSQ